MDQSSYAPSPNPLPLITSTTKTQYCLVHKPKQLIWPTISQSGP